MTLGAPSLSGVFLFLHLKALGNWAETP